MFKVRKPQIESSKKQKVPKIIWILLIIAAISGFLLTKHCHKQLNEYLEVQNIEVEQSAPAFAQISFEIKNKVNFQIKRNVVVRVYKGNLELGSKMLRATLEPGQVKGFYVTIDFVKVLDEGETFDEVSVRFYD